MSDATTLPCTKRAERTQESGVQQDYLAPDSIPAPMLCSQSLNSPAALAGRPGSASCVSD